MVSRKVPAEEFFANLAAEQGVKVCGLKKREGTSLSKKKANVYGRELINIYSNHKTIDSEIVVKEASKKSNALHDYFEWDNTKAGHKYRIQQASTLIYSIVIEIEVHKNTNKSISNDTTELPLFISSMKRSTSARQRALIGSQPRASITDVTSDAEKRRQQFVEVADKLMSVYNNYRFYKEIRPQMDKVKDIAESIYSKYKSKRPLGQKEVNIKVS